MKSIGRKLSIGITQKHIRERVDTKTMKRRKEIDNLRIVGMKAEKETDYLVLRSIGFYSCLFKAILNFTK